jgi:ubiquinone/menaquinone biosynthesis C-methylase UbiE
LGQVGERKGKKIRERYEATASGYDELYRGEQFEKYFVALRRIPPDGVILDAGCGTGLLIEFMALQGLLARVKKYVCMDYSWEMLRRARSRVRLYCPNKCVLVEGNVQHVPFKDSTFDITYSFTVIDLVDDIGQTLSELQRVTRGRIVVSMLKTLPYKDKLVAEGYRLLGVTSKDAIFLIE